MVEIKNLSLSYGNSFKVLKDILNVRKGECVLFTGKSGGGKSSIINSINGLAVRYDGAIMEGTIKIDNREILEICDCMKYPVWYQAYFKIQRHTF